MKSGFTMIELIFVIIILGILAVTALPKFMGVQDDAKIAAEKGVVGAVRGGISLSHSKWLLKQTSPVDWDADGNHETFSATGYLVNLETGNAYNDTFTANTAFQEILSEPAQAWTKTVIDNNTSRYEGPATKTAGVPDEGTNDVNTSGAWQYSNTDGKVTYIQN